MENEVNAFIAAWAFDPERSDPEKRMWSYLEGRRDDLKSDDPEVRAEAENEVCQMLGWLLKPRTATELSEALLEERKSVRAKMEAAGIPDRLIDVAVKRVRVRQRGCPRSKNFDGIAGLRMYWENKSWRQIVLELNGTCKDRNCKSYCSGCEDVRRKTKTGRLGERRRREAVCPKCHFRLRPPDQKDSVCYKCADRMADLVRRLEAYLATCGIHSPRKADEQLREN